MSDKPSLQIDDDWKRQAQEEKRRLAEQQRAAEPKAAPAAAGGKPAARDVPQADFASIVQTFMMQAMYCLGEYAGADGEPMVDLDMAKHYIDLIGVLETKSKGNLSSQEQGSIDSALYQLRSSYVSIATQLIR
jgi:hypothetical protein